MTTSSDLPTVGVEEEFLLVDAETGEPAVNNSEVVEQARVLGVELQYELDRCQVETASGVCYDAHELYTDLSTRRSLVAEAARHCGSRLVAVGVPVVGSRELPVTEKPRYLRMERHFGMLAREQGICGCHVHVAVPDRATAVQVSNHLRPWLPILLSLSANSPIHRGVDTGYASWRSILWSRWPSAGPPPYFSSIEEYDSTVAAMLECGSILDKAMVYWDVRPSANFPTVEVRVCDVPVTVAETVLVAVLVRALVLTALRDLDAGRTAVAFSSEVLRAAYWRAARDGLPGDGIDLPSTARRPAAHLLRAMIEHVRPALEDLGSYQQAREGLHAVLGCGNGAVRQRRVFSAGGTARDVIAQLAELTSAGCTH
ncbi:carboxylate-amine ligase [Rhodococcus indonesiensis]|uniref:carboxylate-amine ligase n=1 Tax=Rhodococcus indonesiensis TaxID=3055869 RepID=UPI0039F674D4